MKVSHNCHTFANARTQVSFGMVKLLSQVADDEVVSWALPLLDRSHCLLQSIVVQLLDLVDPPVSTVHRSPLLLDKPATSLEKSNAESSCDFVRIVIKVSKAFFENSVGHNDVTQLHTRRKLN